MSFFSDPDAVARYAEGPVRLVPGFDGLQRMTTLLLRESVPAAGNVLVLGAGGGLEGADYAWGDEFTPDGAVLANYWQGRFPFESIKAGGDYRTTPVGAFPANGYGLGDMIDPFEIVSRRSELSPVKYWLAPGQLLNQVIAFMLHHPTRLFTLDHSPPLNGR